jgi:hypothetical protein
MPPLRITVTALGFPASRVVGRGAPVVVSAGDATAGVPIGDPDVAAVVGDSAVPDVDEQAATVSTGTHPSTTAAIHRGAYRIRALSPLRASLR